MFDEIRENHKWFLLIPNAGSGKNISEFEPLWIKITARSFPSTEQICLYLLWVPKTLRSILHSYISLEFILIIYPKLEDPELIAIVIAESSNWKYLWTFKDWSFKNWTIRELNDIIVQYLLYIRSPELTFQKTHDIFPSFLKIGQNYRSIKIAV